MITLTCRVSDDAFKPVPRADESMLTLPTATLTCLGTIFYRRSMVSTAFQLFQESLRIRLGKHGFYHRDVSFTMYNIGLCHHLQGNHKSAVFFLEETLRIERVVLGSQHRDVALTLCKLGEALKAEGDISSALDRFEEALAIEKQGTRREDSLAVAKTLVEIGNIYLDRGNVAKMMDAFIESARRFRRAGRSIDAVVVSPVVKLYAVEFHCSAVAA